MAIGVPNPSVAHLLTIFRQISAGELRIPAFQRDFVWQNSQIIELLESVKAGYPVGSILVWRVEHPILKIAAGSKTSFPDLVERYPVDFILDGMQRLSSLYGVFHYEAGFDSKFDVWYDLQERCFFHGEDVDLWHNARSVPLAALFSPRRLIEFQAQLARHDDCDQLLDSLVDLQSAFQDYMLPIVQIRGDDIPSVVTVFERVNSTGTLLGRVDFMRAITWNQDFDLTLELESLKAKLEERNFSFPDETLIKCIAMQLGIAPSNDALLTLRQRGPVELKEAFQRLFQNLMRVRKYAEDYLHIFSSQYIPYEGQLLVLYASVGLMDGLENEELNGIARWFWAASFNESLRGKPDHYVTRAVQDWRMVIRGGVRGLEPRLKLSESDFVERRLIKRKALSTAYACMYAHSNADSLGGQYDLEPIFYLSDADTSAFKILIPQAELVESGLAQEASARILANLVVDLEGGSTPADNADLIRRLTDLARSNDTKTLESQFLNPGLVELLLAREYDEFLWERSSLLLECAQSMVAGN